MGSYPISPVVIGRGASSRPASNAFGFAASDATVARDQSRRKTSILRHVSTPMAVELREDWQLTPSAFTALVEPTMALDPRYFKPVVQVVNMLSDALSTEPSQVSPSICAFSRA